MKLVVAHYREDLSWLNNIPDGVVPVVYSKSENPPEGANPLPNIGREAHTYLTHILNHYQSIAAAVEREKADRTGPVDQDALAKPEEFEGEGVTVFCQGHPFDHCHDFHKRLTATSDQRSAANKLTADRLKPTAFEWWGFIIDTDDREGRRLHVPWSKNPEGRELNMERCHRVLFGDNGPEWYRFVVGAQFAVADHLIVSRPESFYQRALDLCEEYEDASYCLERMWDRVFGVNYVTEEILPAGQWTRYLKPIKRKKNRLNPEQGQARSCKPYGAPFA